MVLEEKVVFGGAGDAAAFIAFLRKKGCPCQKAVQGLVEADEVLTGTLDQALAWFAEEEKRCEDEGKDRDAAWFRTVRESYGQVRGQVEGLLAGHGPGEVLFTRQEQVEDFSALLSDAAARITSKGRAPVEAGASGVRTLAFMLLQENGIVSETPEGFSLRKLTSPREVCVELSLETMPEIDMDNTPGMTRKMRYAVRAVHVVTADPLIHIACDPDEVMEALESLSIPEEELEILAENLAGKQLLLSALLREVEGEKSLSVADLITRLDGMEVEAEGLPVLAELRADQEIVAAVVAELRKRDVLAGTDQKVRMAGKKRK